MTSCQTIIEWLSARFDGEATTKESAAVENHLEECGWCLLEAERLKVLQSLVTQGLEAAPAPLPPPWFAARVAANIQPARRWPLTWPALALGLASLIAALFFTLRPARQQMLSVYELKTAEAPAMAVAHMPDPPSVEHYFQEHVREASSASPIDSQGLVEYVGFQR